MNRQRTAPPSCLSACALAFALGSAASAQDIYVDELGHDYGSADAPVKVIEFSDFSCPSCRRFHLESYDTLRQEYVDTNKVQWKYMTYVSGQFQHSMAASSVAECVADQGRFDQIRHRLFEAQPRWKSTKDPMPILLSLADDVGADGAKLDVCMREGRVDQRLRDARSFGRAAGVRGTPTFLVDGFPLMGALPIEFMRTVFDRRLAAHTSASSERR